MFGGIVTIDRMRGLMKLQSPKHLGISTLKTANEKGLGAMPRGIKKDRVKVRRPAPMATRSRTKDGKILQHTPSRAKYPWADIQRAYVEGLRVPGTKDERRWFNLKELAEHFGANYDLVWRRSSQYRWQDAKDAHERLAALERSRKRAKQIAENSLDFDEKSHNVAKMGLAMVTTRLAEIANEVQTKRPFRDDALRRLQNGEAVEREELYSAVRFAEMEGLASAAARFQEIGRKALGTDVERIDITGTQGNVNVVNVRQEVRRDDPARLAEMLGVLAESGLVPAEMFDHLTSNEIAGEIVEGEVVDEPEEVHAEDDLVPDEDADEEAEV